MFVHDAIEYMTSEADLAAVFETAFVHLRPGGVAVFVPDHTKERFEPGTEHGGSDAPDGRGVRYLEWSWDPDPEDDTVITEYALLLRGADGRVHSVRERHRLGVPAQPVPAPRAALTLGLFPRETWMRLIRGAGFGVEVHEEPTEEERTPREVFVATRP